MQSITDNNRNIKFMRRVRQSFFFLRSEVHIYNLEIHSLNPNGLHLGNSLVYFKLRIIYIAVFRLKICFVNDTNSYSQKFALLNGAWDLC